MWQEGTIAEEMRVLMREWRQEKTKLLFAHLLDGSKGHKPRNASGL